MGTKPKSAYTKRGKAPAKNDTTQENHTTPDDHTHTVPRGWTSGVTFRPGFDMKLLHLQASHDRWAYNQLLQTIKEEYGRYGWANCTRGRIGKWYTTMRERHPFLRQTVSRISRDKLLELGRHYTQYMKTEKAKAAGVIPENEFGEPHFRRYGEHISIPLTITHDRSVGSARFTGERAMRILKMGDIGLSREFPIPNHHAPKKATIHQTADKEWRIGVMCSVEVEKPTYDTDTPKMVGLDRNIGNVATPDMVIELPARVTRHMENLEDIIKHSQRVM